MAPIGRKGRTRRVRARWVVAALVTVVIGLAVLGARGGDETGATPGPAHAEADGNAARADRVVAALTSVPVRVLDAVGTGTAVAYPLQVDAPPLGDRDRPTVLYMGAIRPRLR